MKEGARPVQNADDPSGICSAADCRLVVYQTVALAQKFWIKGDEFSIHSLLHVPPNSAQAKQYEGASLAIFRLAPADYHRFHSPIDGEIGDVTHIPGQYYTGTHPISILHACILEFTRVMAVNPQAVNEKDFDVFTRNTRSVLYITHAKTGHRVAFVAIGALLVGSIRFTNGAKKGSKIKRGEELGYFAYGGSTVVCVFPKGVIQ